MRDRPWRGLGLTEDEWRECEVAAREMSLATGARVRPAQVAAEFAMARAMDAERALARMA